ncbi:MAG: TonB-dependent receptor [Candidatus Acidiferrales bacterium]
MAIRKTLRDISRILLLVCFTLGMVVLLTFQRSVYAQGQVQGNVTGQVTDQSGSAVPEVTIVALNVATGQSWSATTDTSGHYYIAQLPVGTYRVTAEHSGFQKQVIDNVTLSVGATVAVNIGLKVGALSQQVEVTAAAPAFQTTNATTGSTMGNAQVSQLPINGRDYGRFSMLTPGATVREGYIADLSFNGLSDVSNTFSIDGIDATRIDDPYMSNGSERGARLLTGSLDSIGEFSIQTGNYGAQYGRSSGAYINIVSKSGSNNFHGEVWDFFRNTALDARNYFATTNQPLHYEDFGANVGGPIKKNHLFYYVNYEGSRQGIGVIANGTVPSNAMRTAVQQTSPVLMPFINEMPTSTAVLPSDPNAALYTGQATSAIREDTGSVRIDDTLSEKDAAFFRLNINSSSVTGPVFQIFPGSFGLFDGQNIPTTTTNMALSETHIFSSNMTNNFLAGLQRYASTIDESLGTLPQLQIRGLGITPGNFGHYSRTPTSWQLGDTLTWVKGNHTLQMGGTVWLVGMPYQADTTDVLTYNSEQDFINNNLHEVAQTAGNPGTVTFQRETGLFFQDAWQVRPGLMVNAGLRWDYDTVPDDEFHQTQAFNPVTGVLNPPGTPYFNANKGNFGPRVSVAWAPNNSNWVFRTGYGIFYTAYPIADAGFGSPAANTLPGNFDLFGTSSQPLSYPYTPYLSQISVPPPALYGFWPDAPNTYAEQWNFGVGRQLNHNTGILVNYVGNHAINLERDLLNNWPDPVTGVAPIPADGVNEVVGWNGQSNYNALQVSFKRQMTQGFLYDVAYTWSHGISNEPMADQFGSFPENNADFSSERGDNSNDARNQISYNVLWNVPMGQGHSFLGGSSGPVNKIVSGWEIAALGFFRTGLADTVYTYDNGADGNYVSQRADCNSGAPLYGNGTPGDFWNPAAFSDPPTNTFGTCPNSVVRGPKFAQTDFSAIKHTPFGEGKEVEFRVEVFNLFNHTNFDLPDNYVDDATFGQLLSTVGKTIGFGTSREVQLALKIHF